MLGGEIGTQGFELGGIFAGDDDGFRIESVLQSILGGDGFPLLGFGSGGLRALARLTAARVFFDLVWVR